MKMFAIIRSNYPNFEVTPEKKATWIPLMADLTFDQALANLMEFMKYSKFPPVAADIIQAEPGGMGGNYDRLRHETTARFAEMDRWEQAALPECPEHLRPKLLGGGKAGSGDEL
ncbi:hypothetical protein [Paenibacillus xanthanilyticus]|uniref:Replicative helicase inhibitor G39P N-terminal domain-containing protein n=1 Tax=Paenibacillus xanthanilyticus TaxID=1783531 RepID=A0ABV8K9Z8_9BACL